MALEEVSNLSILSLVIANSENFVNRLKHLMHIMVLGCNFCVHFNVINLTFIIYMQLVYLSVPKETEFESKLRKQEPFI